MVFTTAAATTTTRTSCNKDILKSPSTCTLMSSTSSSSTSKHPEFDDDDDNDDSSTTHPTKLPCYSVQQSRHYYSSSSSSSRLFEQSLDVYKPIISTTVGGGAETTTLEQQQQREKEEELHHQDLPLMVLVVGSSWVGHRSFAYIGTSWWNSSGPQTLAQLGYVCVCIRHRGGFPRLSSILFPSHWSTREELSVSIILFTMAISVVSIIVSKLLLVQQQPNDDDWNSWTLWQQVGTIIYLTISILVIIIILFHYFLEWNSRGAATFDTMLDDVAEALLWVHNHRDKPLLQVEMVVDTAVSDHDTSYDDDNKKNKVSTTTTTNSACQQQEEQQQRRRRPLVFGGYSSGGHVAATLLQQSPEFFQARGLPSILHDQTIDAVLFISGVLSVRRPVSFKQGHNITDDILSSLSSSSSSSSSLHAPTWLTNFVVQGVFGKDGAKSLPCPLQLVIDGTTVSTTTTTTTIQQPSNNGQQQQQQLQKYPPHLLIGCTNEVFGLSWLDAFFASREYCRVLQAKGVSARYVEVASNHWNILASKALSQALFQNLKWLQEQHHQQQQQQQQQKEKQKGENGQQYKQEEKSIPTTRDEKKQGDCQIM